MLAVIFEEGLAVDRVFVQRQRGRRATAPSGAHPSARGERGAHRHPGRVRALARDFASAEGAAAYGRTGSCLGRFGTLVSFLLDALNAVTGNLDRPGGAVFGRPPDSARRHRRAVGLDTYGQAALAHRRVPRRDRQPARVAAPTGDRDARRGPDPRAVRLGRNPVLSVPDGSRSNARWTARAVRLARPIHQRDQPPRRLRPAHHHLYEREDLPIALMGFFTHALRPVHRGRGRPAG